MQSIHLEMNNIEDEFTDVYLEIKELVDINFEETIPISSKQILWRKIIVSLIGSHLMSK
jgi:hypothetical protein